MRTGYFYMEITVLYAIIRVTKTGARENGMIEIKCLSNLFEVRKLQPKDVEQIYELCSGNPLFYQYHPPFVTPQSNTFWRKNGFVPLGESKNHVAVMESILSESAERI